MTLLTFDTDVKVHASDGCALGTTIVRPSGTGSWPAVLMRTAYDRKTYASLTLQVHAPALAEAGYAVVLQDVRGRGESDGIFTPFVDEASDGRDTIEWLTAQPWSDGTVGLAGASYNAFTQIATAVDNPPGVRCWVPALAPSDVRTSWIRRGGVLDNGFHLAWGLGGIASLDSRTGDPDLLLNAFAHQKETARRPPSDQVEMRSTPAGEWFFEWQRATDPYPGNPSVPGPDRIAASSAPALVVGGWFDVFSSGSIELINLLRIGNAGTEHRLVMGPWDHSGLPLGRRVGDRDFGRNAIVDLHQLQLRWFDRHLKGIDDETSVDQIFVTGLNRWESLDWPLPSEESTLILGEDLRSDLGERIEVSVDPSDPTPTPGGAIFPWEPSLRPGAYDQRQRRSRPDVVSFESGPLEAEIFVAGTPVLTIPVEGAKGSDPVVVTLVEVESNGRVWNVSDGMGVVDPSTGLTTVELGPVGHQFSAGSSIGVDIAFAADIRLAPVAPGARVIDLRSSKGALRLPIVDQSIADLT